MITSNKYSLVFNIINNCKNLRFYKYVDDLILQKRFDNQYDLSLNENILRVENIDFNKKDTEDLLQFFFEAVKDKTLYKKRNLYEVVKISYLPQKRFSQFISDEQYIKIAECLNNVSRETNLMSFDFLVLTAAENFLFKTQDKKEIQQLYKSVRDLVFTNLLNKNYVYEKREKETTFLCWIDKILSATVNLYISPADFVCLCKKIIHITTQNLYTYRKILYSSNFLLLQQEFSGCQILRQFQKELEKKVENNKLLLDLNQEQLEKIMVRILAEEKPTKEDYYYLLDAIESFSSKSEENKIYCLSLIDYLLYFHQKQRIFNHRHVRKYFSEKISTIFVLSDSLVLKEKELTLLVKLLHTDVFFNFYRTDIINHIIQILASINNKQNKLTHNNFYKYCDILDYVLAYNPDLNFPDIINQICTYNDNQQKISLRFKLSGLKY